MQSLRGHAKDSGFHCGVERCCFEQGLGITCYGKDRLGCCVSTSERRQRQKAIPAVQLKTRVAGRGLTMCSICTMTHSTQKWVMDGAVDLPELTLEPL